MLLTLISLTASLEFIDVPEKLCINFEDSETIYIDAVAKYEFGLKEVEYSISANNIIISGPYTEEADSNEYMFSYEIDLPRLEAGDSVILTAKAKNIINKEVTLDENLNQSNRIIINTENVYFQPITPAAKSSALESKCRNRHGYRNCSLELSKDCCQRY